MTFFSQGGRRAWARGGQRLVVAGALLSLLGLAFAVPTATASGSTRAVTTSAVVRFPAKVSGNGRYFVDSHGSPWFGVGDTAWSLLGQLSPAEIDTYLTDRSHRGVNLVLANVLEHRFSDHAPNNYANARPFVGTPFQSTPNEAYWRVVDHAVAKARALGITLLLCPAYLGYQGTEEGWDTEVAAASSTQMASYGKFLANRYGAAPNVMWLIGHDQVPNATPKSREQALAAKLPSSDLIGLGAVTNASALGSQPWQPTTIKFDFETIYTYSDNPAAETSRGWAQSPARPVLFLEGRYEQESDFRRGDKRLRVQMYGPFAAGASAVIFGNNPIWNFESNSLQAYTGSWKQNLSSPGSRDLSVFGKAVKGVSWAGTQPVYASQVVVAGRGSGTTRVLVRRSTRTALVYVPVTQKMTLDLSRLSGASHLRIRAVDPRSGKSRILVRSTTANRVAVASIGRNAAGTADWLVVIEPAV